MISRKGMTTEVLVPAILILVVILLSLVAFTSGKIPRTFEDFRNLTQGTVRLWEKVTGADEEKLLEEKQAQFSQSYLGLVEAYRTCFSKKQNSCLCKIPDTGHLAFKDHSISVAQHDDDTILFQPYTSFEGNEIILPPGPQLAQGKLCVAHDVGHHSYQSSGFMIHYPPNARLYFSSGFSGYIFFKAIPAAIHLSYPYFKY